MARFSLIQDQETNRCMVNETNRDARKILMIYETRWAIEVLMKELKGALGLGQYQTQS